MMKSGYRVISPILLHELDCGYCEIIIPDNRKIRLYCYRKYINDNDGSNCMAEQKKRLDLLICERMPQYTRQQVQSWIMQGKVRIDGTPITKPGTMLPVSAL